MSPTKVDQEWALGGITNGFQWGLDQWSPTSGPWIQKVCEIQKVGDCWSGLCLVLSQVSLSLSWEKWHWVGPVGVVS